MSVITVKEVAAQYNKVISDLMSKGYIISPFTENGSYSNTAFYTDMIKLSDTSHIFRVWMVDEVVKIGDRFWQHLDVNGVRVKKYVVGKQWNGSISCGQSMWPTGGDTVYEKLYYMFKAYNGKKIFSDDLDEAKRLHTMSFNRCMSKPVDNPYNYGRIIANDKLTAPFVDSVMKRINSMRGFKRANASCIESVQLYKYDNKLKADVRYNYNGKSGIMVFKCK